MKYPTHKDQSMVLEPRRVRERKRRERCLGKVGDVMQKFLLALLQSFKKSVELSGYFT